jgi:hypothetical protein
MRQRQEELLASGLASLQHLASISPCRGTGSVPTIVLGGFVPDAGESVFLLRDLFLKNGNLFCVSYPRKGFNLELLFAQLDDLMDEIQAKEHRMPALFCISFGCGIALEWMRRRRLRGEQVPIRGLVMVSPVTCVEDIIDVSEPKPSTLLGRALRPYTSEGTKPDRDTLEKSRTIFSRMFEAGVQNKRALASLMDESELACVRDAVLESIRSVDLTGACERVGALRQMLPPSSYFTPGLLPLCEAPALVMYAEKEESVVVSSSPARFAFETAHRAYFPRSRFVTVHNKTGNSPVQHASLIFHSRNFRPHLAAFYKSLRMRQVMCAA